MVEYYSNKNRAVVVNILGVNMNEEFLTELIGLKDNDLSFFSSFYEKTKKAVFFKCYSLLKRHDEAEEVMQEVYIKFLENIRKIDIKKSVLAYRLTTAHNLSLNYIKKNRRNEIDYEITNDDFVFKDDIDIDKEILFTRLSYLLNDKELNIVILHVLEDKKHREIAQLLDLPLGTVTYIYSRVIEKLKKGLIDFHE